MHAIYTSNYVIQYNRQEVSTVISEGEFRVITLPPSQVCEITVQIQVCRLVSVIETNVLVRPVVQVEVQEYPVSIADQRSRRNPAEPLRICCEESPHAYGQGVLSPTPPCRTEVL